MTAVCTAADHGLQRWLAQAYGLIMAFSRQRRIAVQDESETPTQTVHQEGIAHA